MTCWPRVIWTATRRWRSVCVAPRRESFTMWCLTPHRRRPPPPTGVNRQLMQWPPMMPRLRTVGHFTSAAVRRPASRRLFERLTTPAFSPARQSGLLRTPNSSSRSVAATFTPSTATLHLLQMNCGRQNRKLRLTWLRWMSGQRPPITGK